MVVHWIRHQKDKALFGIIWATSVRCIIQLWWLYMMGETVIMVRFIWYPILQVHAHWSIKHNNVGFPNKVSKIHINFLQNNLHRFWTRTDQNRQIYCGSLLYYWPLFLLFHRLLNRMSYSSQLKFKFLGLKLWLKFKTNN